jgi:hypothetical protein
MKTAVRPVEAEADLWTGILYPDGTLSREGAMAILDLSFNSKHRERMKQLSAKARTGALSPKEEFEMQNFERVGDLLSILKSKARQTLKSNGRKKT